MRWPRDDYANSAHEKEKKILTALYHPIVIVSLWGATNADLAVGGPDGGGIGGLGGGTRNSSTHHPCCSMNFGSREEWRGREWIRRNWGRGEGVTRISSARDFHFGPGSVWLDGIDANGATWLVGWILLNQQLRSAYA
jgi:hypothetical protein